MSDQRLYCSFCGRTQDESYLLISGPAVFICDACVDDCMKIIEDARRKDAAAMALTEAHPS